MNFDTDAFFNTEAYDYEFDCNVQGDDVLVWYSPESNAFLEVKLVVGDLAYIEYTDIKMPTYFTNMPHLREKLKNQKYTFIGYL